MVRHRMQTDITTRHTNFVQSGVRQWAQTKTSALYIRKASALHAREFQENDISKSCAPVTSAVTATLAACVQYSQLAASRKTYN